MRQLNLKQKGAFDFVKDQTKGNGLSTYGGGLNEAARLWMQTLQNMLMHLFNTVYVCYFSFEGLVAKFFQKWNAELSKAVENEEGGFFGTSRGVELTDDPELLKRAINNCKEENVTHLFFSGGDGTARQVAELAPEFEKEGINLVFTLPNTVDGINGGYSIGLSMAVKAYVKLIRNLASSNLRTRNNMQWTVSAMILQGRNRDEILADVTKELEGKSIAGFKPDEYVLIVLPTNIKWDAETLIKQVNEADKPVLILISEGTGLTETKIECMFTKKVRVHVLGHLAQVNGELDSVDKNEIRQISLAMFPKLKEGIAMNKSFTIVIDKKGNKFKARIEDIGYFAKRNPRQNGKASMNDCRVKVLERNLPRREAS